MVVVVVLEVVEVLSSSDRFRHPQCDTTCATDSLIRQRTESTLVSESRRLDSDLRVPK